MTTYEPSVRCTRPPGGRLAPEDCDEILDEMSTTDSIQTFGLTGSPGINVALPYEMTSYRKWSFPLVIWDPRLVFRGQTGRIERSSFS